MSVHRQSAIKSRVIDQQVRSVSGAVLRIFSVPTVFTYRCPVPPTFSTFHRRGRTLVNMSMQWKAALRTAC
eukprot:8105474-Pyramimonas_sp.AAC.1